MPPSIATRGRQRAEAACEECRRRKLRCDGQQPQCGVCQESGLVCEVTQRNTRGPKRGDLKALRNRVMQLEAMLEGSLSAEQRHLPLEAGPGSNCNITQPTQFPDMLESTAVDHGMPWLPAVTTSISNPELNLSSNPLLGLDSLSEWPLPSMSPLDFNANIQITDAIRAELDQLYWDRVHASIPILHQRRYLSWSKSRIKTQSRTCLQHAMWMLATLLSTQFRDLTEPLYQETKQMLGSLRINGNEDSCFGTELVQAWVLVATCESMRTYHREAWMSAGTAIRLVQGLRFHEIDSPRNNISVSFLEGSNVIEIEEKRRAFWMAYFLDHLLSMRNDWLITLNDHVIYTRLPASDTDFQRGQNIVGEFLSKAIKDASPKTLSPFNECVILASICGRNQSHGKQSALLESTKPTPRERAEQHQALDSMLATRLQVLSRYYPPPDEAYDPLVLFANILGHAVNIHCCKRLIEALGRSNSSLELASDEMSQYQTRVLVATENIVRLAIALRELHFSKIHPLAPIPLFVSAEFLYEQRFNHELFLLRLRELVDVFRGLKNVNNHEQSYMDLLPRSCVSESSALVDYSCNGGETS